MKNPIVRSLLIGLTLLASFSVLAEGNCSFTAYRNCYASNPMTKPGHAMTRALCMMHAEVREGVFTTDSLKSCKAESRNLGQFVKIQFHDFETNEEISGRVYR